VHTLKALEVDFATCSQKERAGVAQADHPRAGKYPGVYLESDDPQRHRLWMMANHSLIMASYISRANAAIIDLRNLLLQG
jgi:hypothetical protein